MLIKHCIYCIAILLSLFSIPTLIYSIKNKDGNICKNIIWLDMIYMAYLFINIYIADILYIPRGLEMWFIYCLVFISVVLYIISIVLTRIKVKKLQIYTKQKKSTTVIMILLITLPALFLSVNVFKDKYLMNNSDLILVYHSSGNGGFGDGETFAYAIGENFCEQFDLGIDTDGYHLQKFLPKNAIMVNSNSIENYEIKLNEEDNILLVYKNNQCICKEKFNSHYFNIDLQKAFYIN